MSRNIFVGDKVKTPYGEGIVLDARTWRDVILDMNDYEAREFSDRCRVEVGNDYREDWIELLVKIGSMRRRVLGHQVTVLEGRNGFR